MSSASQKNFAITGVAGYIAPRHLQAIKDTGNRLVAAMDPHDSVGILDSHFFDVAYYREFERFDRGMERLRREDPDRAIDYLSICSPNYLHDAHIRFALRVGADAICEKPLVMNPWNCDALQDKEKELGRRVYTVLQLREHASVIALKEKIAAQWDSATPPKDKHEIDLTYLTSRGKWYLFSWKGNITQSGGLATNIGIHFFDMLMWVFGKVQESQVHLSEDRVAAGYLELERARVRWFLSIDRENLPQEVVSQGKTTYRAIVVDGEEFEFSGGFTDLHTRVYEEILAGRGYGIEDARPSIQVAHDIRHAETVAPTGQAHALTRAHLQA